MEIILTPEKFQAKAGLVIVRAIENASPKGLAIPVTLNHNLYKTIMGEFRNILLCVKKTDMTRKPATTVLKTTFYNRESGWILNIGEGKSTLALTKDNVHLFRTWLKSGYKPSTMAQWRVKFGS